jgi:Mg-chelatase subunit ChlD
MRDRYLDFVRRMEISTKVWVYTLVVLDRSTSMECRDFPPNRLKVAVLAAEKLILEKRSKRPKDKVGIIAFSDSGEVICPLSGVQQGAMLVNAMNRLRTDGGTNFAAGLKVARKLLAEEVGYEYSKRDLLQMLLGSTDGTPTSDTARSINHVGFLSDGHHNGRGDPVVMADEIKRRLGVISDCIGIGGRPEDVDEARLRAMASIGPDGKARYRFIGDTESLIQGFRRMATLQVC